MQVKVICNFLSKKEPGDALPSALGVFPTPLFFSCVSPTAAKEKKNMGQPHPILVKGLGPLQPRWESLSPKAAIWK